MNSNPSNLELRARADQIARLITEMHPLAGKIEDSAAKGEILRALFELTRQVEVVKKQLLRLEKRDDSSLL